MNWAVVPIKSLAQAKSRLAPCLDPQGRASLVLTMLDRVLAALAATDGLGGRLVVTADARVAAFAAARGARVLREHPDGGLNAALLQAANWLHRQRAQRMLIVPGDIPFATASDFRRLLTCSQQDSLVLVPAKGGHGTGALLSPLPLPLSPMFGPDSFRRHCAAARNLRMVVHESPRIGFDIDEPADLEPTEAFAAGAGRGEQRAAAECGHG
jgi:2-phospho-L-lactate guanylyltransferase